MMVHVSPPSPNTSSLPTSRPVFEAMTKMAALLLLLALVQLAAVDAFPQPKPQYGGGSGVGRLILDDLAGKEGAWRCHYDMVLVERLQKPKAASADDDGLLYVPTEDLPRMHLCRVLSVGPGREEENGLVAPDVDNLKAGDIIIAKNPWGIGPKDEELPDGTKLSFMRGQDVAAVITGGLKAD